MFASEAKNLVGMCGHVMPFPPGHYYKDGEFVQYCDIAAVDEVCHDDLETVCKTSVKSSSPALTRDSLRTQRSASYSPADSTPPSSAP